jgi:hypothetical protein
MRKERAKMEDGEQGATMKRRRCVTDLACCLTQHGKVVGCVVTHPIRFVDTLKDDVVAFVTVYGRLCKLAEGSCGRDETVSANYSERFYHKDRRVRS